MEKEKNEGERVMEITPEILDKIHACGQEILDEFVRICEENHLKYYLIAGTLLGAVRHKGPIPWDDDVDVCMPREDFEKFKKIMLARPEGELYHIHCHENDPCYPQRICRVMKRGTVYKNPRWIIRNLKYMELWIDVLPLDDAPNKNNLNYRLHGWLLGKMKRIIYLKASINAKRLNFKQRIARAILTFVSLDKLMKFDRKLMGKYNGKGCSKYVSWGSKYNFVIQTMPKSWYEPATKVLYNGKFYSAPGQWDEILTRLYGNYMQLPSESEQRGHETLEIKV